MSSQMPELSPEPRSRKSSNRYLLLKVIVVIVWVSGIILYIGYNGRQEIIESQQQNCELQKQDRLAIADFQNAQTKYITKVTGAASVKEDVKRAAREATTTFIRTSGDLTKRAKIDCDKTYRKESLFP